MSLSSICVVSPSLTSCKHHESNLLCECNSYDIDIREGQPKKTDNILTINTKDESNVPDLKWEIIDELDTHIDTWVDLLPYNNNCQFSWNGKALHKNQSYSFRVKTVSKINSDDYVVSNLFTLNVKEKIYIQYSYFGIQNFSWSEGIEGESKESMLISPTESKDIPSDLTCTIVSDNQIPSWLSISETKTDKNNTYKLSWTSGITKCERFNFKIVFRWNSEDFEIDTEEFSFKVFDYNVLPPDKVLNYDNYNNRWELWGFNYSFKEEDYKDKGYTKLCIPGWINKIANNSFYDIFTFKSTIPDYITGILFEENNSLTSIGSSAFCHANSIRDDLDLKKNHALNEIDVNAFTSISCKYISFPKSLHIINNKAFMDDPSLYTISFEQDSSLETIGKEAFEDCFLNNSKQYKTLDLSNLKKLKKIDDFAFSSSDSTSNNNKLFDKIIFPESLETLGYCAVPHILTEAVFPASLKEITGYFIGAGSELKSISFTGNNLSYIYHDAFALSLNLHTIKFNNLHGLPSWEMTGNLFRGCPNNGIIYLIKCANVSDKEILDLLSKNSLDVTNWKVVRQ